ncbi:MAG: hypothetical protein QM784_21775 [Polyangiaceae bacterium]
MTYERSILNSNPSPELKRLLDSAAIDVPTAESKARTKAMALLALRQRQLGSTTQLSAFALGETVDRLLGAVTLANKKVSSFHLAMRGAVVGVLVGAAALAVIATGRWLTRPTPDVAPTVAAQPVSRAPSPQATLIRQSIREQSNFDSLAIRDAEHRLDSGDPEGALKRLDEATKSPGTGATDVKIPTPVVVLRVRCLAVLGRNAEARALGTRALAEASDPRDASELKRLLDTLPAAAR